MQLLTQIVHIVNTCLASKVKLLTAQLSFDHCFCVTYIKNGVKVIEDKKYGHHAGPESLIWT